MRMFIYTLYTYTWNMYVIYVHLKDRMQVSSGGALACAEAQDGATIASC